MLALKLAVERPPTILCIGAHCDDIEIGCGGTLLRWAQRVPDARFVWAIFASEDGRRAESRAAARMLLGGLRRTSSCASPSSAELFPHADGRRSRTRSRRSEGAAHADRSCSRTAWRTGTRTTALLAELTWNTFRSPPDPRVRDPEVRGRPRPSEPVRTARRADQVDQQGRGADGVLPVPARAHAGSRKIRSAALARLRGIECDCADGLRRGVPRAQGLPASEPRDVIEIDDRSSRSRASRTPRDGPRVRSAPTSQHEFAQAGRQAAADHRRRRLPRLLPRAGGAALQPHAPSGAADRRDRVRQLHARRAGLARGAASATRTCTLRRARHDPAAAARHAGTSTGSSTPPASPRRSTTARTRSQSIDANINGLRNLLDYAVRRARRASGRSRASCSTRPARSTAIPSARCDPDAGDLPRQRLVHRPARLLRRVEALRRDAVRDLRAAARHAGARWRGRSTTTARA